MHRHEQTLGSTVACEGIALHHGQEVQVRVHPALPHTGVVFLRTDLQARVEARFDRVGDSRLCTVLHGPEGAQVGTVEHLMAALAILGIDNVVVEVSGPELPILDGSAEPWIRMFGTAQVVAQPARRKRLVVGARVRVSDRHAWAEFRPGPHPLRLAMTIQFPDPAIGRQSCRVDMADPGQALGVARARTFVARRDVDILRASGLALGGGLHNAVVIDGERVLNAEGFRMPDECVRHKMLDAIGDLSLVPGDIWGTFEGYCSGHALNNKLLRALLLAEEQASLVRYA